MYWLGFTYRLLAFLKIHFHRKTTVFWINLAEHLMKRKYTGVCQCFLFSRSIGQVTPKIIYFHYLKKPFLDQSIQKNI